MTINDPAARYFASLKKDPVSRLVLVSITGTTFPLPEVVGASEKRIGLVFYPQNGQSYQISTQSGVVPPAFLVSTTLPPVELWIWKHGGIVKGAFYGSSVSSFSNVTFLEVLAGDDYPDSPFPEGTA